jgi:two-component sensor histidine kinase
MFFERSAEPGGQSLGSQLAAEANHRIANSLSAVAGLVQHQSNRLRADRTMTTQEVRNLLGDIKGRIEAVAQLHRTLSSMSSNSSLDLGTYLPHVASQLVTALSDPDSVALSCTCQLGCRTAPEQARYLGLIVVELITNSIKYAHPANVAGIIELSCRRDREWIVVEVADDGVGLPEAFDPHAEGHSGIGLANLLAQQIDASLSFDSDGLGLRSVVRAPAPTSE